mmetsp:Transcript_65333/g.189348  ORF Transcript_65333/g.189348 Transcript_65333/m.189348 type:complete len:99 (+) Transcript_65333:1-297(+)
MSPAGTSGVVVDVVVMDRAAPLANPLISQYGLWREQYLSCRDALGQGKGAPRGAGCDFEQCLRENSSRGSARTASAAALDCQRCVRCFRVTPQAARAR